jgi:cobalt-precorrin 5A hydrolase
MGPDQTFWWCHITPHPNPPPQGGGNQKTTSIRLRLPPSPLRGGGSGWGGVAPAGAEGRPLKTAILTLTASGFDLARRYRDSRAGEVAIFGPEEVVGSTRVGPGPIASTFGTGEPGVFGWDRPLRKIVRDVWQTYDEIIGVMALGIVVRLFGPLAADKWRDPAIVVVDDAGRFAIAVLGGHGAGANRLTDEIALILGAQAVITTASDVSGLPAVDRIGSDDGWIIERAENLTRVAAEVVRRRPIAVWQEAGSLEWWRTFGDWPEHFHRVEGLEGWRRLTPSATLFISDRTVPGELDSDRTIVYRPPTLVAGIGCKRGTSRETIEAWVSKVIEENGFSIQSLAAVATVMLKVDEPGLIAFAWSRSLPLVAFPSEQIAGHPGIETPSPMVRSKVGLDGVAEPSALRASGAVKLLVTKQKGPGVTLALARKESV